MKIFDFDDYLNEKLKDPEFQKAYEENHKRVEYIWKNVKGVNRQYLVSQLSLYKIDVKYLNTLSTKKLYKIAKQYNINID